MAMVAIALFAPIFAPFAVASWLLLWAVPESGADAAPARTLGLLGIIALLAGLTVALPPLLLRLTAFTSGGSSVWYRTGLDGSRTYFSSMAQAVLRPSYARPWQLLQWPAAAGAAVAIAAVQARAAAGPMLRQLFISWLPLLWTVAVFPQMVSIHPYCFDLPLALGSAFGVVCWLQRPELEAWVTSPPMRLAVVIALTALLMTNLIDLARVAA
jgi:hypothetical protein